MKRQLLIFLIALAAAAGSLVAVWTTAQARDAQLRGYADATRDSNLPFRVPLLGVNAELTQYAPGELAAQLALMRAARVTWVRQLFRWDEIEPERGVYDWEAWDAIVEPFAGSVDLRLVAVLVNSPAWARPDTDAAAASAPPANPADFAAFARAFAERYGATIDIYQIWDEPNLTTGWGMGEPRAADYAALLQAGYAAIHGADEAATVIAAGLAPTTERGPLNVSDLAYLSDLYALGARDFADAFAAKPYSFDAPPDERTVSDGVLNFSRIVALREIMTQNDDGAKALWASNWGWNSLPDDWTGAPSIWGGVSADERTTYTLAALERAGREWTWLGGMILHHWQPDAPPDDPQWGFALVGQDGQPTPLLSALTAREQPAWAADGLYHPANPYASYSGVWTFGALGADIGWIGDSQLAFAFQGRDVALLLRQDDYVAYLYAQVDGQPANALPRDASGNAYIVLTSGALEPQLSLVPVARDLAPDTHTLHVVADRGSDRWALAGYAVSSGNLAEPYNRQIAIALATTAIAGVAAVVSGWLVDWRRVFQPVAGVWNRLSDAAQLIISAATSVALLVGMLLTWGDAAPNVFRREPVQLGLAIASAGVIYLEPGFLLTIAAALVLFVIFYNRLDLALALVLFWTPFFLFPVALYRFAFPMSELLMLIAAAAWVARVFAGLGRLRQSAVSQYPLRLSVRLQPLDWGVLAWLALGVVSLLWAEIRQTAITELRVMMVEPVVFYAILRTCGKDRRALLRLVDALLLAGMVVAVVGLWLYARGESIITAEAGARRLASVYGSPNNVGLFLGRCIPFALAYLLVNVDRRRRIAAGAALAIMLLAVALSQSAGAIFLGVPVAIVAALLLAWGRRARLPLAGLVGLGVIGFALASQSARFARVLALDEGTNFFRIRVWQSAWNAIRDHPLTGLGLDQFLYAFRDRYIMPDAWQEPNLSHPHNFALDFWVRLGILGVAVFVWLQVAFWRSAARIYRAVRNHDAYQFALVVGVMGSMANLLAHGLVDNSVYVQDLCYVFVLLLGLVANLRDVENAAE